jgi:hypothetical protein
LVYKNCKCNPLSISAFLNTAAYFLIKADGGSMGLLKSLYKHRESLNAVFSYDDMVHFEPDCIKQYLVDSYHVSKSGGKALYHQSNHTKNKGGCFDHNPEWRN